MHSLKLRPNLAHSLRIVAMVCATVVVLAPSNAFAAKKLDPCVVVTAADVGAAFGAPFESLGTRGPVCAFHATTPNGGSVDVTVIAKKNAKEAKTIFDIASGPSPTLGKPKKMRGLGDQAIYKSLKANGSSFGLPILYVRDGKLLVYVTGALQGPEAPIENRGALKTIAKGALDNA